MEKGKGRRRTLCLAMRAGAQPETAWGGLRGTAVVAQVQMWIENFDWGQSPLDHMLLCCERDTSKANLAGTFLEAWEGCERKMKTSAISVEQ